MATNMKPTEIMNILRAPNILSSLPVKTHCTIAFINPHADKIWPIWKGLKPRPPTGMDVEYIRGMSASYAVPINMMNV